MTILIIVACVLLTLIVWNETAQDARLRDLEERTGQLEDLGVVLITKDMDRMLSKMTESMTAKATTGKKAKK